MDHALAVVRRVYELWNARDLDAALDLGADDIHITRMTSGQTLTGREGFRRFMEAFATAFPDMKKEVANEIVSGDQVVMEFRLRGRHRGSLLGPAGEIPATGRAVDIRAVEILTIRNGKVAVIRNYMDMATLMKQLGAA